MLRGITRDKIFKIAKSLGIEVEEKEIKASEISDLDSLFISGTSVAILPISQVDDIKFDVNNEILIKIMKKHENKQEECDGRFTESRTGRPSHAESVWIVRTQNAVAVQMG